MKRTNSRSGFIRLIVLIALPVLACNFISFAGGDHYKIYLNKKLVAEQFVARATSVLNLQLNESNYNDEITIYYSHCGVTGKSRSIKLEDDKGNILKEWKFDDAENSGAMTIAAKEILQHKKGNGALNLFYSAKELPNGRMLTSVNFSNRNSASVKPAEQSGYLFAGFAFAALMSRLGRVSI